MKKPVVLFSDLDNTLIYSHRRMVSGEKVLAERLDGREQGYMTRRAAQFLRQHADKVQLVPTTTRTSDQYRRVFLLPELGVRHALVCNGGVLLEGGDVDGRWLEETWALVQPSKAALGEAGRTLADLAPGRTHLAEALFWYAVFPDVPQAVDAEASMAGKLDSGLLTLARDFRKLYVLPKALSKGTAAKRYLARVGGCVSVCAGDGALDVSLLAAGDYAVSTLPLPAGDGTRLHVDAEEQMLSDALCGFLEKALLPGL